LAKYSFALQAKSIDVTKIEKQQKNGEQQPCYLRKLKYVSPVSVHCEQNSAELPEEVRNKIFFHYHHFCSVLGCPHAPVAEIAELVRQKNMLINFFPRLTKGTNKDLKKIFKNILSSSFPDKKIYRHKFIVKNLIANKNFKVFSGLEQGIAYLFASVLNGKRHTGSMNEIIEDSMEGELVIMSIGKSFDSPLLFINDSNNRAFICSSVSAKFNQKLIMEHIKINNLTISIV